MNPTLKIRQRTGSRQWTRSLADHGGATSAVGDPENEESGAEEFSVPDSDKTGLNSLLFLGLFGRGKLNAFSVKNFKYMMEHSPVVLLHHEIPGLLF